MSTYDGYERYYARGSRIEISKSLLLQDVEAGGGCLEIASGEAKTPPPSQ